MIRPNSDLQIDVLLRVHWLSEDLTALAEARSGRQTSPLRVTVRRTPGPPQEYYVETVTSNAQFDLSLRNILAGSTEAPVHMTPFLAQICAALPSAVATALREWHGFSDMVEIPLYLPVLDRRTWKIRTALLPSMNVTASGSALYCTGAEPGSPRLAAAVLAREVNLPVIGIREDPPLTFSFAGRLSAERLHRLRTTLQAYRFGRELDEALELAEDGAEVEFSLSLPARSAARWAQAPGETDAAFLPVWSKVTHAMQRALRRWLPVIALRTTEELARMDLAPAVLAYGLTRSYCGRSKTQLAYDVLDTESLKAAYYSAGRALSNVLPQVYATLSDEGYVESARHYRPSRLPEFVQIIKRDRRLLPALLQLDGLLVDDLVEFAATARKVAERSRREPQKALAQAVGAGEEFGRRFQRRLRTLIPDVDLSSLIDLAMLEATAALAPTEERRAVVTVSGQTFVSDGFSHAQSRKCAA